MRRFSVFLALLLFIFTGCPKKNPVAPKPNRVAAVTSNTTWSGYFENRTVDGTGNQVIDISDEGIVCCVVQKQTTWGIVTLTLSGRKAVSTIAEYGIVDDCVE